MNNPTNPTPSPELLDRFHAALSWLEPPFIDAETSPEELRSRISFCLADGHRAIAEAAALPTHSNDAVVRAARQLSEGAFATYRKADGSAGTIESDDGEACWIVHHDDLFELRTALSTLSTTAPTKQGEAE